MKYRISYNLGVRLQYKKAILWKTYHRMQGNENIMYWLDKMAKELGNGKPISVAIN